MILLKYISISWTWQPHVGLVRYLMRLFNRFNSGLAGSSLLACTQAPIEADSLQVLAYIWHSGAAPSLASSSIWRCVLKSERAGPPLRPLRPTPTAADFAKFLNWITGCRRAVRQTRSFIIEGPCEGRQGGSNSVDLDGLQSSWATPIPQSQPCFVFIWRLARRASWLERPSTISAVLVRGE